MSHFLYKFTNCEVRGLKNTKQKQNNIALTILIVALILTISVIMSFITVSLSHRTGSDKKEYTASEITSQVIKKMNYDNLSEISSSNISKYYDIPEGTVLDCSMYISARTDNFTEIACFRLSSEDRQEQLMQAVNDYIAEKTTTYKTIGDNAYSIITSSRTDIKYPYVLVAITPDSEAAISAFESIVSVNSDLKSS